MTRKLSQKSASRRSRIRYGTDPEYREKMLLRNAKWWKTEYASTDPAHIAKRKERQRKASRKYREDHREENRTYKREYWRGTVAKITPEELEEFRAIPSLAHEYAGNTGYVICFECGAKLKTLSRHPLQWHGMRNYEYRAKWPDAPRVNPRYQADLSARGKKKALTPATPKDRGRPKGTKRVWKDTPQKITFCAHCKIQGMNNNQIAQNAVNWPGPHITADAKSSFLKRHASDITKKVAELSASQKL